MDFRSPLFTGDKFITSHSPMLRNTTDSSYDAYRTLSGGTQGEINVKGSRFKSFCEPIISQAGAEKFLESLRTSYRDATHHCFAYIILDGAGETIRTSDDGEPSGTAGKPILTSLQRHNLTNVVCVVIRYYGGTNLGKGGLSRAYADSAESALSIGKTVEHFLTVQYSLSFPYEMTGGVEQLLGSLEADIVNRKFGEESGLVCSVRKVHEERLIEAFRDVTRGKGTLKHSN